MRTHPLLLSAAVLALVGSTSLGAADRWDDGRDQAAARHERWSESRSRDREGDWGGARRREVIHEDRGWDEDRYARRREVIREDRRDRDWDDGGEVVVESDGGCGGGWEGGGARVTVAGPVFLPPPRAVLHALLALPLLPLRLLHH